MKPKTVVIHLHSWEWLGLASILVALTKRSRNIKKREIVSPLLQIIGEHISSPPSDKVIGVNLPTKSLQEALSLMKKKMPAREPYDLHGDHAIFDDVRKQLAALNL